MSDAGVMNGSPQGRIEVIRILVLVEAAIAVVMSVEALGAVAFGGPAGAPIAVIAALAAIATLWLVRGIRRRRRRARRLALWLQGGIVFFALVDLALAILVAQRGLELVPTLTRLVLPIAIFRLLRKPDVRTEFGARQGRRVRRRAAEVTP